MKRTFQDEEGSNAEQRIKVHTLFYELNNSWIAMLKIL